MAKDFSAFLGPKKKKSLNLTGPNPQDKVRTKFVQTEDKLETKPGESVEISQREHSNKTKNRQPLDSKKTAIYDVSNLTGKESVLVRIIFNNCQNSGSLETPNMATDQLRNSLEITTKRLGNLIERLRKKGIFEVTFSKRENGGFRRFKLFSNHYQKLVLEQKDSRSTAIRQQKDSHYTADWTADKTASPSSSSREIILKTATTSDELWKTLDLSFVEKMGINKSAVFEARQKFGPFDFVEFEKFLTRFSLYMSDSKKSRAIGNARGFFFSLCKQIREGIEPLSEIVTPEDEALERLVKEKELALKKRQELEQKLMDFEFEDWMGSITRRQKLEIAPESNLVKEGTHPHRAMLKNHFEANVWPRKKGEVLDDANPDT